MKVYIPIYFTTQGTGLPQVLIFPASLLKDKSCLETLSKTLNDHSKNKSFIVDTDATHQAQQLKTSSTWTKHANVVYILTLDVDDQSIETVPTINMHSHNKPKDNFKQLKMNLVLTQKNISALTLFENLSGEELPKNISNESFLTQLRKIF